MVNNLEKIAPILNQVQKRQRARLLSLVKIVGILEQSERLLKEADALFPGVAIHYDGAEHFPRAYNGTPTSTHFRAVFDGSAWDIVNITREKCPNRKTWNTTAILPDGSGAKTFLVF